MKAILGSTLVALFLPILLAAAEPKGSVEKTMHLPLKGTVIAVTPVLLTLKGGEGKPDRKFNITSSTVFLRGDEKVPVDEVRLRQYVTGSFVRSPAGIDTLSKLQLAPKPPSTPKKKDSAKSVTDGDKKAAN
jgi:hypothetical protein